MRRLLIMLAAVLHLAARLCAQTPPAALPRLTVAMMQYEGAFRLPADDFGASSLNYSEGPLVYNPARNSIFIVGHSQQQAIAEFAVPALVKSTRLADLKMAAAPLQGFVTVLDRASNGNPQALDVIGGLGLLDGQLVVNAYEYYDADGGNTHTTLIVRNSSDLAHSRVEGFYAFAGGAGHTSGWLAPIPEVWQSLLGGTHLTGQSSGMPIISRLSVGPSAFACDARDLANANVPNLIPTTTLLDFSLAHPLHEDLENTSRQNDLWTHLSRVTFGLIVPGTRTYATFGYSGGHQSGVCYKCTQNNGNECGGYCAPDAKDYQQSYWFWDVNDLLSVKNGQLAPHAVRPYAYGALPTPFENAEHQIGGGSFDPNSGQLFLAIQKADTAQGTYANPPVILVYRFVVSNAVAGGEMKPASPHDFQLWQNYPNPFSMNGVAGNPSTVIGFHLAVKNHVTLQVFDVYGREVATLVDGERTAGTHQVTFTARAAAAGLYFYKITAGKFTQTRKAVLLQ